MTLDREKLKKLGLKVVEPTDETAATVHFVSKEHADAVRASVKKSKPEKGDA